MKHGEYVDVCERVQLRDEPVWVKNIKTGERGEVLQCTGLETPEAFLVKIGDEVTSWSPWEVCEDEGEQPGR